MTTNVQPPRSPERLRIIPISKPGVASISFAAAINDEVEEKIRKEAVSQGLLAGQATPVRPDRTIWELIDCLKKK